MIVSLKIGAVQQTLEEWDANAASIAYNSFAADEFTFTLCSAPAVTPAAMDVVEVYVDATRIFKGVLKLLPSHTASTDYYSYTAAGLWFGLERLPWRSPWVEKRSVNGALWNIYHQEVAQIFGLYLNMGSNSTNFFEIKKVHSHHSVAFVLDVIMRQAMLKFIGSARWGFTAPQITAYSTDVLDWGSNQERAATTGTFPKESMGDIAPWVTPPYEEKVLASAGDLLASCTKWMPDLVSYYNYAAATPILTILPTRTAAQEAVTIEDYTDLNLNQQDEVRASGLILEKLMEVQRSTGTYWAQYKRATEYYPTGTTPSRDDPLVLILSYDVERDGDDPGDLTALATSVWEAMNIESMSGTLTFLEEDYTRRFIARKLALTVDTQAAKTAIVQADAIDLMTGLRTLTFGASKKASSLDIIDQFRYLFSQDSQKVKWPGF